MHRFLQYCILLLFIFLPSNKGAAQCIIKAPRVACVNDLVNFSISNSSGTISSYAWNFGSYGNSSNSAPTVKFTAQGTLVVSCTLTLAGGGTCSDTHSITILPNPKAASVFDILSDSCSRTNRICMKNLMQKGAKGLYSVNILWGDGDISLEKTPLSKSWCHHYTDSGTFEQRFELADSAGCKDIFKIKIHIAPSPQLKLNSTVSFHCDSSEICFTPTTTGGKTFNYDWYLAPYSSKSGTGNTFCKYINRGMFANVRGVVTNEYGCKDTVNAKVKSPDSGISYSVGKRRVCTSQVAAGMSFNAGDPVTWELNGKPLGTASFMTIFSAKPGWNYMKISSKNPCPMTYIDSFFMSVINIKAQIKNEFRSKVIDTVWVQDLSKNAPGSRIRRLWNFGDNMSTQCTTWAKKNYLPWSNCNYSKDSIAWHYYKNPECLYIRFSIYDSSTGCEADTVMAIQRTDFCPKLIIKEKVCLGDYAFFAISKLLSKKIKTKNFIITDIKGKRDTIYFKNATQIGYIYTTPGYKSPVFWRYYDPDTVWTKRGEKLVIDYIRPARGWVADTFKNGVEVMYKPNPSFTIKKLSNCNPSKAEIHFTDSFWLSPKQLVVDWGDTIVTYKGYTDTIAKLAPLSHTYNAGGDYVIEVTMVPMLGCSAKYAVPVSFGYYTRFLDLFSCGNKICFRDTVRDYDGKNKWTTTNNLGKLYWDFGDGTKDSGYSKCHTYKIVGNYSVKLTAVSNNGCKSQYTRFIKITRSFAAIKHQPTIYCSEVRQYFDSSYTTGTKDIDSVTKWSWNFGDGSAPVSVRNPAHVYPVGGIYTIRLIVTTARGCKDTAYRNFNVMGPQVSASILSDSMGCAPLKITFGNQSKNTGNFIWEFGDKNNTFYSTTKDTNVGFTYSKPGVYFAHITGGDSFINPVTLNKYFCSVRYPAPGQKQLRITVFPGYYSAISIPDTICVYDSFPVLNISDTTYPANYFWNMGNRDTFTRKFENFNYKYKIPGNYTVQLKAAVPAGTPCVNTAKSIIRVLQFTPGFEQDCDRSKAPILYFKNTAGPDVPNYQWTIFTPPDTANKFISNGRDLKHDFGFDTGTKTICLKMELGNYCKNTTCKNIVIKNGIYLANVFTPGSIDGYNDTYRVPVYGYEKYELKIFNRWGERIFFSEDPAKEWNGKVENTGPELPSGTYFYQFSYRDHCDKKIKTITGSINLIR